jgi:outer membrane lipoprotein-sorting protein
MNAWFIGDYSKLTTEYTMSIIQETPLVIQFVPKNQKAVPLKQITVSFFKNLSYVRSIYIVENGGDTVKIVFKNVILNKTISEQAWDPKANVQ